MKIRQIVYIIFFLISSTQAQRQAVLNTVSDATGYNLVPQEKIFIHYNTSLLFAGEYLYYSVYNLNVKNDLLSKISKVAYVVLLDENGTSVFKHKIKLENGLGQGDFFVPVSIPSGNYKIVGYTQWMLNADDHFFQGDISIINPYQGDQSKILAENISKDSLVNPQTKIIDDKRSIGILDKNTGYGIDITTDNQVYKKRSLVKLIVKNSLVNAGHGNYSISVREKNTFNKAPLLTTKNFSGLYDKNVKNKSKPVGASVFLPEMRGELIYGKIVPENSTLPVSNQSVGLSLPGKTSDLKIVSTDDQGNFVFNLHTRNDRDEILIQVLGENKENYAIVLDEIPEIKYSNLDFYKFEITPVLKDVIVERSVYNQIDNNFYGIKPDTVQSPKPNLSFYGENLITYNLDDYTRFATVKETMVEVVENAWTRKGKDGKEVFGLRANYTEMTSNNFLPLLIVDGLFVQDHDDIINYDARNVQSISFIRDRYYLGNQIFGGVIIIETINGDYTKLLNKNYLSPISLTGLQYDKRYFRQKYGEDKSYNRIPDFRNQLFWLPDLKITSENTIYEFYTSDVTGDFEIVLEGFGENGSPVSIKKHITVE